MLKSKIRYTFQFIKYLCVSKPKGGFGIHSPFVFYLITQIIEEKKPYYCYHKIERLRNELKKDQNSIFVADFGTGKSSQRKIATIAKRSLKPRKYAQLLFRLTVHSHPRNILELGTSLGITTAYLASANSKATVYTIEGSGEIANIAKQNFRRINIKNIQLFEGQISSQLPNVLNQMESLDLVFFDANHKGIPTLSYFNMCLEKINSQTIFIFDDIYWSKEMTNAWQEIYMHPKVSISIDLFSIGIVFFNPDLKKEHYIVKF